MKNPHAAALGRIGGRVRSEAKTRAVRKNGKLGGRPKRFREMTAYQAIQEVITDEDWQNAFMNFVDGFRRRPSYELIQQDPMRICTNPKLYALLQSICLQLCFEQKMRPKLWLFKPLFLPEPWFVSGIKNLYALALKESPIAFRKNNIFVLGNFLNRA